MSRPVRGRSFKITKNQARGYGYAKARRMAPNPGVTTIAAINGRGAYAGRSARSVMSKHRPNARPAVARRRLTAAQKAAFVKRMKANRSTSSRQSQSSRSNIKKAQRARKAWGRKLPRGKRVRVGSASYGRKPKARRLTAGVYIANRRKKAGSKTMARRRKKPVGLKKKRRSSKRRRTTTKSAAPRRKRRRTARKGKARRKTTARKTTTRRRRARRSTKLKANRRRRHRKNPAKRRRSRRAAAAAPKRRRRKSRRKGSARRAGTRKRRVSRRRRGGKRLKANRRRRSHRRNPRRATKNRRRSSSRRKSHSKRRSHKANRRRHRRGFKRNGVGDVLQVGLVILGGFALHRVLSNLIGGKLIPMLSPAPAAAPAATSGIDSASPMGFAVNLGTAALTGFAVSKMVKNPETKKLILGGIVMSVAQTLITSLLQKFAPASFADALSGPEDGTAARLSAMYGMRGLGQGASIMPRYQAIGEYFREPMSGVGEYFREPTSGVGEYIAATSGIGTYEPNADLYQAAAGMGNPDNYQGNHIDPSGDLDRQLTIAEAAAGVGALSPFEAAAGIGPMQAAAGMRGFGAIDTVASGDTWIPGTTNGQLWAGVKSISAGQSASEMTPAGILQTDGGSGIFG